MARSPSGRGACRPRRLRPGVLARASWTQLAATFYALYRSARLSHGRRWRLALLGALTVVAVALAQAAYPPWGGLAALAALVVVTLLLTWAAGVLLLLAGLVGHRREVWTDEGGSMIATTVRTDLPTGPVWVLRDVAAWPVRRGRAAPFLGALCALADQRGLPIQARAGNAVLVEKVYRPLGFVITRPGERPGIRREVRCPPEPGGQ